MRTALVATLLVLSPLGASAQQPTAAEQRSACTSDAMKLCAADVPDRQKIEVCLKTHRSEVSADCRSVLDGKKPGG